MVKSPDAFRTISEVADWLGIQAHVLRFWESKFTQVKPIKRAGGRRYYRPADMLLLGGIKKLLHDDGLTIKGVQKILREDGMTHVSSLSAPLDELESPIADVQPIGTSAAERESGVVLKFGTTGAEAPLEANSSPSKTPDLEPETKPPAPAPSDAPAAETSPAEPDMAPPTADPQPVDEPATYSAEPPADNHPRATPDPLAPSDAEMDDAPRLNAAPATAEAEAEAESQTMPLKDMPEDNTSQDASAALPGFLQRPLGAEDEPEAVPSDSTAAPSASEPPPAEEAVAPVGAGQDDDMPKPAVLDLPDFTPEADFPAAPGLLTRIARVRRLPRAVQPDVATLLLHLADMRGQMDANSGADGNF